MEDTAVSEAECEFKNVCQREGKSMTENETCSITYTLSIPLLKNSFAFLTPVTA